MKIDTERFKKSCSKTKTSSHFFVSGTVASYSAKTTSEFFCTYIEHRYKFLQLVGDGINRPNEEVSPTGPGLGPGIAISTRVG